MKKILLLLMFTTLWLESGTICIISSSDFPARRLSAAQVRAIFLAQKRWIADTSVLPINYPPEDPSRQCLERTILKKSRQSLRRYWLKAHYNGYRPPKVVKSSEALLAYLREVPGAIGYVDANTTLPVWVQRLHETDCR